MVEEKSKNLKSVHVKLIPIIDDELLREEKRALNCLKAIIALMAFVFIINAAALVAKIMWV